MLIGCPHCGTRPLDEFTFMGDATPQRPQSSNPESMEQWFAYVYQRDNPNGRLKEYAHHSGGCRSWLVVTRDTRTHEVFEVVTARDFASKRNGLNT
jgi:methylglutamate dehydrogenase subunit B